MYFIQRFSILHKLFALLVGLILFIVLFGCVTVSTLTPEPPEEEAGSDDILGSGGTGGDRVVKNKPVGFVNRGSIAATVMAWTYIPLDSDVAVDPPGESTVTFPPTAPGLWPNPSRFLSLPMGTYTWCYYWDLGDQNDDGYIEYFHAFDTRPVVLDENDQDELELAESVDLIVPPSSGILPGMCAFELTGLRFGNDTSSCVVTIENGIVTDGHCGLPGDPEEWIIESGTFDGEILYIKGYHVVPEECNSDEFWLRVEDATVTQYRWLNLCGDEWIYDVVFTRWE